ERAPIGVEAFPVLAAIAATPDLPAMFLRRGEESEMLSRYTDEEPGLLVKPEEEPYELDLDLFLSTMKTAMILESWIDETPLVDLTERFGIGAGDLRAKVEDADWLLFGASRLASHFNRRVARPIDDLALRVRYGVREELLDLVRVRGIGRVRARALFGVGITDRDTLCAAPLELIERALRSRRLAEQIMREVAHPRAPPVSAAPEAAEPTPSTRASTGRPTRRLEEFPEEPPSTPDP
ncbi:MAG: hypothetical protein L3K17_09910, partial [Thermoplasmata archaeon]|nr:hypothetical protein [Thermoplasmata archaeon]